MSIQPIDLPSLLKALSWPVMTAIASAVFRRPLATLISVLGRKVSNLSIGKFSIEIAQVQEMKSSTIDTEIWQLEAGLIPQSGSTSLTALVNELQSGGKHDYVVSRPDLTEANFADVYNTLVGQYDKTVSLQNLPNLTIVGSCRWRITEITQLSAFGISLDNASAIDNN
jgi:hypothetical protein